MLNFTPYKETNLYIYNVYAYVHAYIKELGEFWVVYLVLAVVSEVKTYEVTVKVEWHPLINNCVLQNPFKLLCKHNIPLHIGENRLTNGPQWS